MPTRAEVTVTPKSSSSTAYTRTDLYLMGFILLIALAIAAQVLDPSSSKFARSTDESGRELQSAPETGN